MTLSLQGQSAHLVQLVEQVRPIGGEKELLGILKLAQLHCHQAQLRIWLMHTSKLPLQSIDQTCHKIEQRLPCILHV